MADRHTAHEGIPLRLEAYPSPGPRCARNPRDARALQVSELALECATAAPEQLGIVLRVRANEPIGATGRRELITRVVACQSDGDGRHRLTLAILGTDRLKRLEPKRAAGVDRYSVPPAT